MEKTILLYNPNNFSTEWSKALQNVHCQVDPPAKSTVLIRWGSVLGGDKHDKTLNRKKALLNVLNRETALTILKLNRIRRPNLIIPNADSPYPIVAKNCKPADRKKDRIIFNYSQLVKCRADFFTTYVNTIKDYKAWVFNAKVFHLEKKVPVRSNTSSLSLSQLARYEPIPLTLDSDSEKATHLAVKAVHLLGLDFAKVRLGIDQRSRPVVLDVNPVLTFNPIASEKFSALLEEYLAEQDRPPNITRLMIGADPEFILKNNLTGALVFPSSFVEKEGLFGYDERSERREGQFYPLAEVRPTPDTCPLRLTAKIKQGMEYGLGKIPFKNIEWLAGSIHYGKYQIGGHVHFSGLELSSALLRTLDNYLAVPVSLIEDPKAAALRRRQYGGLGNIRVKPHGGFEYRTLGSWLVSPSTARAVLCLAKLVAQEHRHLKRNYFVSFKMQEAFYKSKREYFMEVFPLLWNDIKQTRTYQDYKSQLQIIPDMIGRQETWNEQQDIRRSWGLPIPQQVFVSKKN